MSLGIPSSLSSAACSLTLNSVYERPISAISTTASAYTNTRRKNDFFSSVSKIETFYGMVESSADALRIFQLCREGELGRVRRRLHDHERKQIRSGSIFVFNEIESGIKRWTDGRLWSPSRIFGDFLIYRELERKYARRTSIINQNKNQKDPEVAQPGMPSEPTLVTSYHLISSSACCSPLSSSSTSVPSSTETSSIETEERACPISENEDFILSTFTPENSQFKVRAEILDSKFKSSFFSPTSPIARSLNVPVEKVDSSNGNLEMDKSKSTLDPLSNSISTSCFKRDKQFTSRGTNNNCLFSTFSHIDSPKSLFIIKEDGLIKKTLSMTIDGQLHHMVCYYSKLDFMLGKETKNLPSVPLTEINFQRNGNFDNNGSEINSKPTHLPIPIYNPIFPQILPKPQSFLTKKEEPIMKRKRRYSSNSIPSDFNIGRKILPSPPITIEAMETPRMAGMRSNSHSGYLSHCHPLNYNYTSTIGSDGGMVGNTHQLSSIYPGNGVPSICAPGFNGALSSIQLPPNFYFPRYNQASFNDEFGSVNRHSVYLPHETVPSFLKATSGHSQAINHQHFQADTTTTLPDFSFNPIESYAAPGIYLPINGPSWSQDFFVNPFLSNINTATSVPDYGLINNNSPASVLSNSSLFNTPGTTTIPNSGDINSNSSFSNSSNMLTETNPFNCTDINSQTCKNPTDNYFPSENILNSAFSIKGNIKTATSPNEENINGTRTLNSEENLIQPGDLLNSSFQSTGFNTENILVTTEEDILNTTGNTILFEPNGHFPSSLMM